jgi:hypothetical protein
MWMLALACTTRVEPDAPPAEDPTPAWNERLGQIVDDQGFVDYEGLRRDPSALSAYVAWLARPQDLTGPARLAMLMNAYNAFVLEGVLRNWPLSSVREVKLGLVQLGGGGFFVGQRFLLEGSWVSLTDLENTQIREAYQDPRVHAGINCASAGCPPLPATLWVGETLDGDLDAAMTRFVQTRTSVDGDQLVLSQIFEWFDSDFIGWGQAESLCAYTARFEPAHQPIAEAGCPHTFTPYDWSLNAADGP